MKNWREKERQTDRQTDRQKFNGIWCPKNILVSYKKSSKVVSLCYVYPIIRGFVIDNLNIFMDRRSFLGTPDIDYNKPLVLCRSLATAEVVRATKIKKLNFGNVIVELYFGRSLVKLKVVIES